MPWTAQVTEITPSPNNPENASVTFEFTDGVTTVTITEPNVSKLDKEFTQKYCRDWISTREMKDTTKAHIEDPSKLLGNVKTKEPGLSAGELALIEKQQSLRQDIRKLNQLQTAIASKLIDPSDAEVVAQINKLKDVVASADKNILLDLIG